MKNIGFPFFVLLSLFIPPKAHGQITVAFDFGPHLGLGKSTIPSGQQTTTTMGTIESTIADYSLGKGIQIGFTVSQKIQKAIGIDLSLTQLSGADHTFHSENKLNNLFYRTQYRGNMTYVTSGLRLESASSRPLSFFVRSSIGAGLFGNLMVSTETNNTNLGFSEQVDKYSKGVCLAYQGNLGMQLKLKKIKGVSIYTEVRFIGCSFGPKKRETIEKKLLGKDILNDLPVNSRITIYKNEYVRDLLPVPNPDLSKPTIALKQFYPFSSLGIHVGCAYDLSAL